MSFAGAQPRRPPRATGTPWPLPRQGVLAAALALSLGGCAVAPPQPEISPLGQQRFEQRRPQLEALDAWQLRGRAAFAGPSESGSASLDWRQQGQDYRIALRGPLGSGSVLIEGGPSGVTVATSAGERASSPDPAELVQRLTGYALPVEVLPHWLRGMPAPGGSPEAGFDAEGRLRSLAQQGWEVSYTEYGGFLGRQLPVRLEMQQGPWRIRIVVGEWRRPS